MSHGTDSTLEGTAIIGHAGLGAALFHALDGHGKVLDHAPFMGHSKMGGGNTLAAFVHRRALIGSRNPL